MGAGLMHSDFESWFAGLMEGSSAERRALVRPWFAALYEQSGPVTTEVAIVAWAVQQLDHSELGAALTVADVRRTTTWEPEVEVSTWGDTVAITVEGHTRTAMVADPWDQHGIVCDIAEIIQEDVTEWHMEVWPMCARHVVGLHAEVQSGRAVWWCRSGEHVVSEIGLLGA